MNKAYGKTVLAPTGKFGGMLRYEFDIGTIGPKAKGGSGICGPAWSILKTYQNLCWLTDILVIKHQRMLPQIERDLTTISVFSNSIPASHKEGHTKTLKYGKNVMVLLRRQANAENKMDAFMWADNKEYQPSDKDYEKAKEKRTISREGRYTSHILGNNQTHSLTIVSFTTLN